MMRIEPLTENRLQDFIAYCKKYRSIVDESFLTDEDLHSIEISDEQPTYLLLDGERVIGVASLMMDDYFLRGKKGRFRIFHSELDDVEAYRTLMESIIPHTSEIHRVFLFTQDVHQDFRRIVESLGFGIERYSYVLDRPDQPASDIEFPLGYELRDFVFDCDEDKWRDIRNEAFANLAGSETPITVEQVKKMKKEEGFLKDGLKLLYYEDEPVGLLRLTEEPHKGETHLFIHLLAVRPSHQKKGLGRNLLRSGIQYGRAKGLPKALLTVNAENENAVKLYLAEGFQNDETMICYNYNLK
ncbi:GNAT family N-acetyltransferase [Pseudalkalibacillus sp. Hm43]|uniref:GNAT family N-acetyltransferase n=1 Tax=Pseudalkalibacillus sp. Hm43 TaxID=3450742 RepID=UPI003F43E805